jgi:hypothetical protein
MAINVQFVGRDGCYVLGDVRVRCAPGHGEGSLRDEHGRAVLTPLGGDSDRELVLECVGGDEELARFVEGLPVARLEPPGED